MNHDELHDALCRQDAAAVRSLLLKQPDLRQRINEPALHFNSPAIVAFAGDPAMVDVLLEFGADPNRRSEWWAGPFHALYAATAETAPKLIAAGAVIDACAASHLDRLDDLARLIALDPECVHERGGDGQTPLHFARSQPVIDLLLATGADINARDVDHRATPAEWMLDHTRGAGRYELARYLVDKGAAADIFLAAALGLTGRVRAILEGDPKTLDLRIGRGDYSDKLPSSYHIYFWTIGDSRSPLDVAAQFEQQDTLEVMLTFATPRQRLLFACGRGEDALARQIAGRNPQAIASLSPDDHRALADAAWRGDARAVSLMLDLGFNPRTPGHDSGTALHLAAWEGSADTVAALLRHPDASELIELKDGRYGGTPLGWCCHGSLNGNRSHDHAGVARLLLEAGTRPTDGPHEASPAVAAVIARFR